MDHLRKALSHCKYPKWAMDRVERRFSQLTSKESNNANTQDTAGTKPTSTEAKTKAHIVIHYTQGVCKSVKKICSKHDTQTHFKGNKIIKNILLSPKDKDHMENKKWTYWFQCGELACDEEPLGETSRTFGERFKEQLKETSPIYNQGCIISHITTQDNFQIIGREDNGIARTIKESIYIRVNNPTIKRNIGKFNLHHIWDGVLFNTPGLKINGHAQETPSIGHAQSIQPNTPMHIFTGSMEHAQRTPLSEHVHRTSQNIYKHRISFLPQT